LKELAIDMPSLKKVIDNYIQIGENQRRDLLAVSKQVRELSLTEAYHTNYRLLLSVPGIGLITAMTFLVQISDRKRFERLDDLCNYIGLVPKMYGSGDKMQVGKMIKRGRKELKIMLIEAHGKR
jgi:transposase